MKRVLSGTFGVALLAVGLIGYPTLSKAAAGDPAKGKEVFEQCAACHNVETTDKKMGPSLKGLFKKATLKNGKKVNDANVKAKIDAGGGGMPAYAEMLNDQEKNDLLAYLHTI